MQNQYPNTYYEQLAQMAISNPSIPLKNGEVCFYQGKAKSYKIITQIKEIPKKKTSLLLTPWFVGVKRKTNVEVKADLCLVPAITKAIYDRKEYYTSEMLGRCYDRYNLPHHYFDKPAFAKLLNMVFEDETIDIMTL